MRERRDSALASEVLTIASIEQAIAGERIKSDADAVLGSKKKEKRKKDEKERGVH